MSTLAVLAAKEAAVASGFSAGLVPAIGAGPLDGFAIGALVTGACFLAIRAPRRLAVPRRAGGLAVPRRVGASVASRRGGTKRQEAVVTQAVAGSLPGPEAAAGPEAPAGPARDGQAEGGYRSRHRRLTGSEPDRSRPPTRRSAPRHAAPQAGLGFKMAGLLGGRTLAGGAHT